jgi:hypothetical protein
VGSVLDSDMDAGLRPDAAAILGGSGRCCDRHGHRQQCLHARRNAREGDRRCAQWNDLQKAELIPRSENRFPDIGGIAPVRFIRDADGKVTRIVSEEVEELVLQRVP